MVLQNPARGGEFLDNIRKIRVTKQLEKIAKSCTIHDIENSLRDCGKFQFSFSNESAPYAQKKDPISDV